MEISETIETIKCAIAEVEWNYPINYAAAFEKAIEALEKQISKKPRNMSRICGTANCPNCSYVLHGEFYCTECGQAIDWSEE